MLVAVALALSAMVSFAAAGNVLSKPDGTYENQATHDITDPYGNQYVADPYAPAWGQAWYANAINDTFTVGNSLTATAGTSQGPFCFDSTAVFAFNAAGYTKLTLYLRSIPPVDSTTADSASVTYWGIQVRKHATSAADTSNTAVWHEWASRALGAAGVVDTVTNWGGSVAFTYPHTPAIAFPGERVFKFDDHIGGVNPLGSTGIRAASMTGPVMIAVDVGSPASPFNAAYVSIRVHCIARVGSLANANPSRRPRFILGVAMGN